MTASVAQHITPARPSGQPGTARVAPGLPAHEHHLGGLNRTLLQVEFRRVFASPRRLLLSIGLPVALSLTMNQASLRGEAYGRASVAAMIMMGMALYGAAMATSSTGAAVSIERASGWTRQLRLTPLNPVAYIAAKSIVGLAQGGLAVVAIIAVAWLTGNHLPASVALESGAICWLGSGLFAAFGLFLGYLLPTDNALQVNGLAMAAFAMLGGVFMPLRDGSTLLMVARFTPMWGIHQLMLAPFGAGDFSWVAVANVVGWLAVFVGGAAWRMGRDTQRV